MFNSIRDKSILAGGATFALCLVAMLAGGLTWFTGAAGWCVFLAFMLSVFAGFAMWVQLNAAEAQQWKQERRDTIDRMEDAQRCIKAEEKAHERTKRELVDVRQQLTQANTDATTAKTEYGNMRDRAAERGRTIKALEDRIASDNNTWRKQVSNVREAAYNMAVHIEGSANGLPDEWQEWGAELARDLRALAGAAGVENDNRQVTIDEALAEPANPTAALVQVMGRGNRWIVWEWSYAPGDLAQDATVEIKTASGEVNTLEASVVDWEQVTHYRVVRSPLPAAQTQPTPLHAVHVLMAKVRANQAERRANLDRICKAIEDGYELGASFTAAYHRGALWVSDEIIGNEVAAVKAWEVAQRHAAGSE